MVRSWKIQIKKRGLLFDEYKTYRKRADETGIALFSPREVVHSQRTQCCSLTSTSHAAAQL
jgi:hypothetical protein